MFYKKILPFYLAIGVPEERIMDGTPKDLEPFKEAYRKKQMMDDEKAWRENQYNLLATSVAISRTLYGKKSKAKYIEKPFLQLEEENRQEEKDLTEKEKKNERNKLLAKLKIMQINFSTKKGEENG